MKVTPEVATGRDGWDGRDASLGRGGSPEGAELLDAVAAFVGRFVSVPTDAALVAIVLWIAHAHAVDAAESTPRLALLSPEPQSGKTRVLEVAELLVPSPMHAVNATPAALFRAVGDAPKGKRPTILFDEIDTVFGPRARDNEEVRGMLNAGHRRGAVAYRCVGEGTRQKVKAFPAFAAVALAGIGDLPDTILDRSIVIRMRRRAPGETIESFRRREHVETGHQLRDRLAEWAEQNTAALTKAWPAMPPDITDRPADVWEALLAIADAAGDEWPKRAREACVELVAQARATGGGSLGVRLLADLHGLFTPAGAKPKQDLFTADIINGLHAIEDAPWGDVYGRLLNARGLARRLRPYGISSKNLRSGTAQQKGYERADFLDAWSRYLPSSQPSQPSQRRSEALSGGTDNDDGTDGSVPDRL